MTGGFEPPSKGGEGACNNCAIVIEIVFLRNKLTFFESSDSPHGWMCSLYYMCLLLIEAMIKQFPYNMKTDRLEFVF